jgi:hypothetical protein
MGIDIGRLSRLTRRSRSAVRRALAMVEADRLRTLLAPPAHDTPGPLAAPQPPGKPDAKLSTLNEALNAAPARTSLGSSGTIDLLELIAAAPHTPPPLAVEERARALAYHRLRTLAREEIEQLDAAHPSAAAIDRINTHLRWAARLKAELLRAQLRVIIETLESRATRPLAHLPAAWLVHALPGVFDAAGRAIDIYEPWRGGRLAGPMTLAIDRHAARFNRRRHQKYQGQCVDNQRNRDMVRYAFCIAFIGAQMRFLGFCHFLSPLPCHKTVTFRKRFQANLYALKVAQESCGFAMTNAILDAP